MRKCFLVVLALLAVLAGPAMGHSVVAPNVGKTAPNSVTPIKHVVVILKENRSFDNYFGKFPGANGATTAVDHNGRVVPLAQTPDPAPNDVSHSPASWLIAYNNGQMNGFDLEQGAVSSTGQPLALSQMSESQIPNYWAYARRYGLADSFFAPWQGASFTNNLFSVSAQAGQYDPSLGGRSVYWNPNSKSTPSLTFWGCDDPADTTVSMIDPVTKKLSRMFPCFGFPSLPNTLAAAGISWHFYNTIGQQSHHDPLDALTPVRKNRNLWSQVVPTKQFMADVSGPNMPAVSWIVGNALEHPPASACNGENQTVGFVNAIMNSPNWSSTAILIYWDEWGGFYDHVTPPIAGDGVSFGFRVPFLVISPYSKVGASSDGGSISSTMYSHTSVLKFIEDNWGLASMTPKDAAANNLMDMFDFTSGTHKQPLLLTPRSCPALTPAQQQQVAVQGD